MGNERLKGLRSFEIPVRRRAAEQPKHSSRQRTCPAWDARAFSQSLPISLWLMQGERATLKLVLDVHADSAAFRSCENREDISLGVADHFLNSAIRT